MPVIIKGQKYYRTTEASQMAGVGRSTLLRWLKSDIIKDASRRDRRGWRLFTDADIERIQDEAERIKQI
jgi:DNA-binding transcriptional MerR regulator